MSILKSRPLPGEFKVFESLQLGSSITYAEESFRKVLTGMFGSDVAIARREIIIPNKKNRPEPIPHDPDGHILKGQLANSIARRNWESLTKRQQEKIYAEEDLQFRKENYIDFDTRTVFFRAIVQVGKDELPKLILAKVVAFALSGWWNMAEVQLWYRQYHYVEAGGEPKFTGSEFQVDSNIHGIIQEKDWQPPEFLKFQKN